MISVIIPTYNRANVISRSIKSVLEQTYRDIELIIIDDNSSDNTDQVISRFNDSRIKYIKLDNNKGACFARNYGVEISKGEYIAFQDSDDYWLPMKLEKQIKFLQENNYDLVSCQIRINKGNEYRIFPRVELINDDNIYIQNYVSTQTILCKRECFNRYKFDENLPRFQDWDFILGIIKEFKVGVVTEPLVDVFLQENSISKDPKKAILALEEFIQKHAINNKVKAHYFRLLGVYKLQDNQPYSSDIRKSFFKYPFNKKIILDLILSHLNLKKLHYHIYKKMGRFS
ncbi:glycosyltransferase family 2 protein [Bacillus sp. FJAT-27986]|uniref:glycosyltransferase family 2 protein n=1 Tax=Bacillus sp. FJAT-27986 TaxID=1743146 RepID=UPI00080AF1A0|nr:glycosyltransferase family 2 protein [Bacillus sp. FJAT-27986]OCA84624.1 hypothetical protein A8L44_09485 [Bacillus sp. FJAT-27986]